MRVKSSEWLDAAADLLEREGWVQGGHDPSGAMRDRGAGGRPARVGAGHQSARGLGGEGGPRRRARERMISRYPTSICSSCARLRLGERIVVTDEGNVIQEMAFCEAFP